MAWGWTQEQLGTALNTDQTAVSAWERDKVRPSGAALQAISRLMGLRVETTGLAGAFQNPPVASDESSSDGPTLKLPALRGASAILMDLRDNQSQTLADTQEAILKLIEAGRRGRGVWIVLE